MKYLFVRLITVLAVFSVLGCDSGKGLLDQRQALPNAPFDWGSADGFRIPARDHGGGPEDRRFVDHREHRDGRDRDHGFRFPGGVGPWIPPPDGYPYIPVFPGPFPETYPPGRYPIYPIFISEFSASPGRIYRNDPVTISWSVNGAATVGIDGIGSSLPLGGAQVVYPSESTIYTLRAYDRFGAEVTTRSLQVTVIDRPPVIVTFWAERTQINRDESSVLHIAANNCREVQLFAYGDGAQAGTYGCVADITVRPQQTTTYTIRVQGLDYQVVDSSPVTISVNQPPEKPVIDNFYVTPSTIDRGQTAELRWNVSNASRVEVTGVAGVASTSGALTITPQDTTTYVLRAYGPTGGMSEAKATIQVNIPVPPPRIEQFQATPSSIEPRQPVKLTWQASNCVRAEILEDQRLDVPCQGVLDVSPASTKSYTLRVYNSKGEADVRMVSVQVLSPTTVPSVDHFYASSMVILRGQSTTIHWAVSHASRVEFVGLDLRNQPVRGSFTFVPERSMVIRLNAYDNWGQVATAIVLVQVGAEEKPSISYFYGQSESPIAVVGRPYRLFWQVRNCYKIEISGVTNQDLPMTGFVDIVPQGNQHVTLRGYGFDGTMVESHVQITTMPQNPTDAQALDALLGHMRGSTGTAP